MTKSMAEILAEHSDWQYQGNLGYYRSEYICQCGGTFWYGDHEEDPNFRQALSTHQSAALTAAGFGYIRVRPATTEPSALSAAGYGLVADAKRGAWDEGKDAVWTFMSNQDPRRERPTNPYRKASNDDQ